MPIHEFICDQCGHQFEEFFRQTEKIPNRTECPHCETKTATRLPSAHGGYSMSSGGSSTRPSKAGSFRGRK